MEWYVVIALAFCSANFVTSLALLGLSSYHIYDEDRYISFKENEEWLDNIIALIPTCVYIVIVSIFSCWGVNQKRKKWTISVVALNALSFFGCIYFVVAFGLQLHADPISGEELLERTNKTIAERLQTSEEETWIPTWLDQIQRESASCCGIMTYKDWEMLWPDAKSEIPASCCLDPSGGALSCPKDLSRIPYPGTPAKFIKVDHGCVDEINTHIKKHILESYKFMWILTCLAGVGEIIHIILYYLQYYWLPRRRCMRIDENEEPLSKMPDLAYGIINSEIVLNKNLKDCNVAEDRLFSSNSLCEPGMGIDPDTGNPSELQILNYETKEQIASTSVEPCTKVPIFPLQQTQQESRPPFNSNRANIAPERNTKAKNPKIDASTGDDMEGSVKVQEVHMVQYEATNFDNTMSNLIATISGQVSPTLSTDDIGDRMFEETIIRPPRDKIIPMSRVRRH